MQRLRHVVAELHPEDRARLPGIGRGVGLLLVADGIRRRRRTRGKVERERRRVVITVIVRRGFHHGPRGRRLAGGRGVTRGELLAQLVLRHANQRRELRPFAAVLRDE